MIYYVNVIKRLMVVDTTSFVIITFFGVDANARMARTSKMNMIMHGDGHVGGIFT